MTKSTYGISRPLEATSVATKILASFVLNLAKELNLLF